MPLSLREPAAVRCRDRRETRGRRTAGRGALALATLAALALLTGCAPIPLLVALAAAGGVLESGRGGSSGHGGGGGGQSGGGGGVEPQPFPQPAPSPFQTTPPPQPSPSPRGLPGPSPSPTPFVPATLSIVSQPTDVTTVGVISPTIQVTLQDAQSHVPESPSGYSVTIALGTNPGNATLHGTTTVVVGAAGSPTGVATFGDLNVDTTGTGYTLVASLDGSSTVSSVASAPFDVTTALPVWLAGATSGSAESAAISSNGLVYFTDANGNLEALAPDTGVLTNNLPSPPSGGRRFARLAPDTRGRIYLMGGLDSGGPLGTVEVYDPGTNAWATLPPLPTPRSVFGATLGADGRIYALGGAGSSATIPLGAVEAFDPVAGTWATLAPLPTPRRWLAASATPDGHVYAIGGFDPGGGTSPTVEVYSIAGQAWTSGPDLGTRRIGLAAATALDGSLFVVGGDTTYGDWGILATAERLTPGATSWAPIPNMLHARAALGAVTGLDGRLVSVGGFDPFGNDVTALEAFGPSLVASATSGTAGSTVVLTGSNFGPSASLTVTWVSAGSGTALGSGTTDVTGTIAPAIQVTVPSVAPGSYTITVTDPVSAFVVSSPFTVN